MAGTPLLAMPMNSAQSSPSACLHADGICACWACNTLGIGQFLFIEISIGSPRSLMYLCLQTATTASWDKLDFIMESMANKHTIADNQQVHLA